jgi:hypothetical protein
MRTRDLPETDGKASARMMRNVEADEQAVIAGITELRGAGAFSFETSASCWPQAPSRFRVS